MIIAPDLYIPVFLLVVFGAIFLATMVGLFSFAVTVYVEVREWRRERRRRQGVIAKLDRLQKVHRRQAERASREAQKQPPEPAPLTLEDMEYRMEQYLDGVPVDQLITHEQRAKLR